MRPTIPEPGPYVFQSLVRLLREWNELARQHHQVELARTFKGMARQAGPDDVEPLLDEIFDLWHEMRRAKVWELADGIRTGLQGVPGLIIEDRPGGLARWRFESDPGG